MKTPKRSGMAVACLPAGTPFIDDEVVRLPNTLIDGSRSNNLAKFYRRQPVMVINDETGRGVLRYAMGEPANFRLNGNNVGLDYEARTDLALGSGRGKAPFTVTVSVRPASRLELFRHYLKHPNGEKRLAMQLAALGVWLGLLGFISGVASLVVALV